MYYLKCKTHVVPNIITFMDENTHHLLYTVVLVVGCVLKHRCFLSCDWLLYTYYAPNINLNTFGITYHPLGYWDGKKRFSTIILLKNIFLKCLTQMLPVEL